MGHILVELRGKHFLQVFERYFSHLKVIYFVSAHRLKNLIHKLLLCLKLVKLFNSFNLSNDIFFEKKLKEPVVVFLLHTDLSDVLHIRVNSDPKHR
jgi:hypothetical protein